MSNNIRVLYKKTGEVPRIKFITDMFEIKKMIVKGKLDLAKYENCIIVCNSKERRKNKIPNIVLDFKHIAGDFFLIGYDEKKKDFRSLDIDEAMFYIDSLQHKSFRHKEYEKWIKKQNKIVEHKEEKDSIDFNDYEKSQKELAKKLNTEIEKANLKKSPSTEMLEMILGIQAMILRYIKQQNGRRIIVMEREKFKELVHEIYVQNRYLFQKYRHEISHFSKNGIVQEWTKSKYEYRESR